MTQYILKSPSRRKIYIFNTFSMNRFFTTLQGLLIIVLLFMFSSCSKRSGKSKVLLFSKTAGFHHESIADGIKAIQKLGSQHNFEVDTTTNADWFIEDLSLI